MDFTGKVALVTGGGSGIGAAVSKTLAAHGARVVVADLADEGGAAVVAAIRESDGEAAFVHADVTEPADVQAMVDFAVSTFGRLDVAHNNAGIVHPPAELHEFDLETFQRVLRINTQSVFLCLRAEIAYFLEHGGGVIVNTASGAGIGAVPDLSAYITSKHAVVGLTRAAAVEYAGRSIRVNAVAPGTVETPMTAGMSTEQLTELNATMPLGRMAKPQEVANVVAFLLSDDSSYMNGAILPVDGGSNAKA
ncbi:MAG: 2,5-dichloro-2,5-cyclohexadiene,4-diol dehydrogenase [Subtercola sp.]|nr:2,5-dichloro-2,5-cyclohexadiene,4-diol dehydrogenase [Subtercola sp.]